MPGNEIVQLAALLCALPVLLLCADRLRMLWWRCCKAPFVVVHIGFFAWAALSVNDILFENGVATYQLVGLATSVAYLWLTHKTWRRGVPPHAYKPGRELRPEGWRKVSGGRKEGG